MHAEKQILLVLNSTLHYSISPGYFALLPLLTQIIKYLIYAVDNNTPGFSAWISTAGQLP